ncbi:MAG TPA: hypothetical protein DD473_27630 [Planctomycetaceae bacterium]|nr:hypothetical protein [Planctomycetaceae bacterium]
MKSEHRHELAQNDLEVGIERLRDKSKDFMEVHGNRILLWASMILLLIAAIVFYTRTSARTNVEGWAALTGANNAEELAGIADSYQGTPVGDLAQLKVAEEYLNTGIRLMFTDREAALTELDEAKSAFQKLLNQTGILPITKDRALFGLARTFETTSTGDFSEAIKSYKTLIDESPDSPYKELAEERIKTLGKENAKSFYAWFAEQKPEPQDMQQPEDMLRNLNLDGDLPTPTGTSSTPMDPEATSTPNPTLTVPTAPDFPPAMTNPASTSEAGTSTEASAPPMPAEASSSTPPAEVGTSEPMPAPPKATEPEATQQKPEGTTSTPVSPAESATDAK